MPELILAMSGVLAMWLVTGFTLTGLGLSARSAIDKGSLDFDDLFRCFWLGFAITTGILLLWHFWLPIDWRASTLLLLLGLSGIVQSRKELRSFVGTLTGRVPWILVVFFLGVTLWLADLAIAPPDLFDSGNYHLTAIRWATAFPIIPGLGNLDTHLAFNNSSLLYQAALECGFWYGRSSHIGNGPLLLVLVAFCLVKTRQAFLQRGFADLRLVAPVFFLPLCVTMACDAVRSLVSNPGTDLPAIVVCFAISWLLADFVISRPIETSSRGRFHFLAATTLCASAPTIKLSALSYAAAAWLVISILWLSRCRRYRLSMGITSVIVAAYFGVVWITASTILSGYPVFPSTILPLPVDWRIPRIYADGANWLIVLFARTGYQSGVSAEGFAWVGNWFGTYLRGTRTWGILPITLSLFASLYLLSARTWRGMNRSHRLGLLAILLPGLIAVPVWFFTAPAFRFGGGTLWIIGSQLCGIAIGHLGGVNERRAGLVFLGCCILPCLGLLSIVQSALEPGISWWHATENALLVGPGPDHGFHPVHRTALMEQKSLYGVECYVPARRDAEDWRDRLAWDCPLPGAADVNRYLMLRGATLASGFRIREATGTWASRNAEAVKKVYGKMGGNVGRAAVQLGVDPAAVREALRQ
jgi:hypothetical protein